MTPERRPRAGHSKRSALRSGEKSLGVLVKGSLIVNDGDLAIRAALDGIGIARLPLSSVDVHVGKKRLVPLLEDWKHRSMGFYLYYPSRRQVPAALKAFVDFIKAHSRTGGALHSDK